MYALSCKTGLHDASRPRAIHEIQVDILLMLILIEMQVDETLFGPPPKLSKLDSLFSSLFSLKNTQFITHAVPGAYLFRNRRRT